MKAWSTVDKVVNTYMKNTRQVVLVGPLVNAVTMKSGLIVKAKKSYFVNSKISIPNDNYHKYTFCICPLLTGGHCSEVAVSLGLTVFAYASFPFFYI